MGQGGEDPHGRSGVDGAGRDREGFAPVLREKTNPVYGDWLVLHAFSEPGSFNPYGGMDYGSYRILENVFESMLYMEAPPPYEFKGKLAKAISGGVRRQAFLHLSIFGKRSVFQDGKTINHR